MRTSNIIKDRDGGDFFSFEKGYSLLTADQQENLKCGKIPTSELKELKWKTQD